MEAVTNESDDDAGFVYKELPTNRRNSSVYRVHCERCRLGEVLETHKNTRKRLIIVSIICFMFMIAEMVGGILSNSLALATDAAHLLSDLASFMISLLALYLASKPATERMNFGWYRAEIIGALMSIFTIWIVTGALVYEAVERVIYKEYKIEPLVMLIVAAVGVFANFVMGLALKHGDAHMQHRGGAVNINIKAAIIHVVGDFIQSVGVLVAALVIYFKPEYKIADPICTFLFSVLVLLTTFGIFTEVIRVLMEGTPKGVDLREIHNIILGIPGVVKVHNLRLWALSLERMALSAHVSIGKGEDPIRVLKQTSEVLITFVKVYELTLQMEEYDEDDPSCILCQEHDKDHMPGPSGL